jgi:hypothetical protein
LKTFTLNHNPHPMKTNLTPEQIKAAIARFNKCFEKKTPAATEVSKRRSQMDRDIQTHTSPSENKQCFFHDWCFKVPRFKIRKRHHLPAMEAYLTDRYWPVPLRR